MRARHLSATTTAVVLVALAACGASGAPVTGSVPLPAESSTLESSSALGPHDLLFAVLEAHGSHATDPLEDDTVAIVGIDGIARAKATFDPRMRPFIGNAAPVLEPEARVAAGAVFFVDGRGTVRRLAVGAATQVVTTFPILTAQTELSFAVSADGRRLAASGFTFPQRANPPPCDTPIACPFAPGPFHIDVQTADAGGVPTTIRHEDRPQGVQAVQHVPAVLGWDAAGPLMTADMITGTQQVIGGRVWFGDIVHMGVGGRPVGAPIGGAGCSAWSEAGGGLVLCAPDQGPDVSVRTSSGTTAWKFAASAAGGYVAVSPDGERVAVDLPSAAGTSQQPHIRERNGTAVALPQGFHPEGWLDSSTLIGIRNSGSQLQGPLAIVHLQSPTTAIDLGFSGSFVGVVHS